MSENDGMIDRAATSHGNIMLSRLPRLQTLALVVGIALILATLSNGAGFYLRKMGIIDADAYRTNWTLHCNSIADSDPLVVPGPGCRSLIAQNDLRPLSEEEGLVVQRITRSAYATPAREIPLKLLKDIVGVILIGLSIFLMIQHKAKLPAFKEAWPMLLLLGYVMASFVASWTAHGAFTAVAGLRPFMFIVIALTCRWLAPYLSVIAQCLVVLLAAEALLASLELIAVKHMIGHLFTMLPSGYYTLAARATGTLILTNTMGAFAAASLAFYYTFSRTRSHLPAATGIALALILASGSATGFLCMLCFLFFLVSERIEPQRRVWVLAVAILTGLAVFPALPLLTGRPSLFGSLVGGTGRIDVFLGALADKSLFELIFGRGIGLNTNLALNFLRQAPADALAAAGSHIPPPTDSTVTGLIIQTGILGTLTFYGCLLWAALRDRSARMFYVIIFVCSLTLNIGEVFPVNFLLGLALAHSLAVARRE